MAGAYNPIERNFCGQQHYGGPNLRLGRLREDECHESNNKDSARQDFLSRASFRKSSSAGMVWKYFI